MRARIKDIDIAYRLDGTAQAPVVMLSHSLAATMDMWKPQLPVLTKDYRVLSYDMRGHGDSSAPHGAYDFPMLAGDVIGLLDDLKIERVAFVGISIGGMIGQYLAIRHAHRLRCVALCSTTSAIPEAGRSMWDQRIAAVESAGMAPQVEPTLERWFTAPFRDAHPEVMDWIGAMIRATPTTGFIGCGRAIQGLNLTGELPQIGVPTLVLPGQMDPGTPPALSDVIHKAIPGSEYSVVLDAAHLANIEQASAFNDRLSQFLRRHAS
jgi:3-oxoadipate enol-lactonase